MTTEFQNPNLLKGNHLISHVIEFSTLKAQIQTLDTGNEPANYTPSLAGWKRRQGWDTKEQGAAL